MIGLGRTSPKPQQTANLNPVLEGAWSYGTATPLERPPQFIGKAFFDSDADAYEYRQQAQATRRATQAARLGVPEFVDAELPFVSFVGRKPTSVVFDPPNGRIPYIAPEVQQQPLEDRFGSAEDIR